MNHVSVSRSATTLVVMGAVLVSTACEDKRVAALHEGIPRDSAISVISHGVLPTAAPDSQFNVYTRARYLIGGKNYEVLYFTPNNEKAGKDAMPLKKLTPLVFVDNRMVGKGWEQWDSISTANKIPLQNRDSIAPANKTPVQKR